MTASPTTDTIEAILRAEAGAPAMTPQTTREKQDARDCLDAVDATLEFARNKARILGRATRDPIAAIFDNRVRRQARGLLLKAVILSLGLTNTTAALILDRLHRIDSSRADDFRAMEELWGEIEDAAREMARECREYAGGDAA